MHTPRKIVITGASGDVGTALLRLFAEQEPETSVTGIARRTPPHTAPYDRTHSRCTPRRIPALPVLPLHRTLALPVIHTDDVADAVMKALRHRVPGPFNIAADEPLTANLLRDAFGAHLVHLPAATLSVITDLAGSLNLSPVHPGLDRPRLCPPRPVHPSPNRPRMAPTPRRRIGAQGTRRRKSESPRMVRVPSSANVRPRRGCESSSSRDRHDTELP